MSTLIIPTAFGSPAFRITVELDGEVFGLRFQINRRDDFWRMTVERDGVVLLSGVKIVTGGDLLIAQRYIDELPAGILRADDTDGLDAEPTEANFGDRVKLLYDEAA